MLVLERYTTTSLLVAFFALTAVVSIYFTHLAKDQQRAVSITLSKSEKSARSVSFYTKMSASVDFSQVGLTEAGAQERARNSILGGIVADASGLGVHWMYGDRQVEKTVGNEPYFLAPDKSNYGVHGPDYYAHDGKLAGDNTHVGAMNFVTLKAIASHGGVFSPVTFQNEFRKYFGPGGPWVGYVDHAMKDTLWNLDVRDHSVADVFPEPPSDLDVADVKNAISVKLPPLIKQFVHDPELLHVRVEAAIRATHNDDRIVEYGRQCTDVYLSTDLGPPGADDHQMGSLNAAIPVIVRYAGTGELDQVLEVTVRQTANNDIAVAYIQTAARILERVLLGASPREAALSVFETVNFPSVPEVKDKYKAALDLVEAHPDWDAYTVAKTFGSSCFLRFGVPCIIHTLLTTDSFVEGVRASLLGGGDNVSRAGFVGAIYAAAYGIGGDKGIPAEWIEKTVAANNVQELTKTLFP